MAWHGRVVLVVGLSTAVPAWGQAEGGPAAAEAGGDDSAREVEIGPSGIRVRVKRPAGERDASSAPVKDPAQDKEISIGPGGINISSKADSRADSVTIDVKSPPVVSVALAGLGVAITALGLTNLFFGGVLFLLDAVWFFVTVQGASPVGHTAGGGSVPYLSMPFALLLTLAVVNAMSLLTVLSGILFLGTARNLWGKGQEE
jgi:hypothetical protein